MHTFWFYNIFGLKNCRPQISKGPQSWLNLTNCFQHSKEVQPTCFTIHQCFSRLVTSMTKNYKTISQLLGYIKKSLCQQSEYIYIQTEIFQTVQFLNFSKFFGTLKYHKLQYIYRELIPQNLLSLDRIYYIFNLSIR